VNDRHWQLVFSPSKHGTSLATFHRKMATYNGPSLTFIKDTQGHIFGCYASDAWRKTEKDMFYGNAECFVFTLAPDFAVYPAVAGSDYFMCGRKSKKESIVMGGAKYVSNHAFLVFFLLIKLFYFFSHQALFIVVNLRCGSTTSSITARARPVIRSRVRVLRAASSLRAP
jgi:hypothetical protein